MSAVEVLAAQVGAVRRLRLGRRGLTTASEADLTGVWTWRSVDGWCGRVMIVKRARAVRACLVILTSQPKTRNRPTKSGIKMHAT